MDRNTKINQVLNYRTRHDDMFDDPNAWKRDVLLHFNQIYRKEIGMRELVRILQENGVNSSEFSHTLWKYPIRELLEFIANISQIVDLDILPHMEQRFYVMHKTSGTHGQILLIMDTFRGAQLRVRAQELDGLAANGLYTESEIELLRIEIADRI